MAGVASFLFLAEAARPHPRQSWLWPRLQPRGPRRQHPCRAHRLLQGRRVPVLDGGGGWGTGSTLAMDSSARRLWPRRAAAAPGCTRVRLVPVSDGPGGRGRTAKVDLH
ncbi:hypothetical protein PVAP13_9KG136100 [Panicum virgatum]|uniref:Uncharacterized protein n=1 Tax=Panicum virgatum TaxID=38727 RepID=A0A8T0NLU5_PANVG|nr:hypothetical protein PVAP13_9KG136100 [Panicum virgatum]